MFSWIILSAVFGFVVGAIAKEKGRNVIFWTIIGFVLNFIGLVVILLPPVVREGINKTCMGCHEVVKVDARLCKHCGASAL